MDLQRALAGPLNIYVVEIEESVWVVVGDGDHASRFVTGSLYISS